MPGVELKASVRDGQVVVTLRGELDVTGAADVEAAIAALVAPDQVLIIDLSALDFMDCASLGALMKVQALARQAGVAAAGTVSRGNRAAGLRCALHALGGQPHRILISG